MFRSDPLFWFIFAVGLLLAVVAMAHDHPGQYAQYTASQRQWLKSQMAPGTNGSCCSEIDAEEVQVEIRDGRYWIQGTFGRGQQTYYEAYRERGAIEGMDANGWVPVPEAAVLTNPNLAGHPVVWWGSRANPANTLQYLLFIRCFAPGELY